MPRPRTGSKARLKEYLRNHVGEIVTARDLQVAAGPQVTEWARRVREIREEGWPIRTHNDDAGLRPGEYRLDSMPPDDSQYAFTRRISARLRAQVLERNGYTCQMCGAGAGEIDDLNPGRTIRLHIGHIVDQSHGGGETLSNLRALCSNCNQGAQNMAQEPPSWTWVLSQVRRASEGDQRRVMDWLRQKFGD